MKKIVLLLSVILVLLMASCGKEKEVETGLNPGIDTVEINGTWTDAGAYLRTEEDDLVFFSDDEVDITVLGEYTIEYEKTFEEKLYKVTRMVVVLDETDPIVSLLSGLDTIQLNNDWVDGGCEVIDNSLEILTCSTESTVDTTTLGVYEVLYTAEDSSGNIGEITRIVTVVE